jgi:hypothetical protein
VRVLGSWNYGVFPKSAAPCPILLQAGARFRERAMEPVSPVSAEPALQPPRPLQKAALTGGLQLASELIFDLSQASRRKARVGSGSRPGFVAALTTEQVFE